MNSCPELIVIISVSYTTGKTKGGQTFEEFLGDDKMDAIEDEFDDFLNECFCKSPKEKQNEFVTHQIDSAAEDCAERALNDSDSDIKEEEGDKDAEDKKKSECEHEEPKNK